MSRASLGLVLGVVRFLARVATGRFQRKFIVGSQALPAITTWWPDVMGLGRVKTLSSALSAVATSPEQRADLVRIDSDGFGV